MPAYYQLLATYYVFLTKEDLYTREEEEELPLDRRDRILGVGQARLRRALVHVHMHSMGPGRWTRRGSWRAYGDMPMHRAGMYAHGRAHLGRQTIHG